MKSSPLPSSTGGSILVLVFVLVNQCLYWQGCGSSGGVATVGWWKGIEGAGSGAGSGEWVIWFNWIGIRIQINTKLRIILWRIFLRLSFQILIVVFVLSDNVQGGGKVWSGPQGRQGSEAQRKKEALCSRDGLIKEREVSLDILIANIYWWHIAEVSVKVLVVGVWINLGCISGSGVTRRKIGSARGIVLGCAFWRQLETMALSLSPTEEQPTKEAAPPWRIWCGNQRQWRWRCPIRRNRYAITITATASVSRPM